MVDTDPTCNRHLDIAAVWLVGSWPEKSARKVGVKFTVCVKKMLQVISIMASSPHLDRRSDQIAQCAATVTIAEGTTTIADRAFEGCVQMRTLVLPSTLTRYRIVLLYIPANHHSPVFSLSITVASCSNVVQGLWSVLHPTIVRLCHRIRCD